MKRPVLVSRTYLRAAKRLFKRQPLMESVLQSALAKLAEDAFAPSLGTHKLKGNLQGRWSCNVGYDLRLVFRIVPHKDSEAILLQTVGTHDEVY